MAIYTNPSGVSVETTITRSPIPGSATRINYVGLDDAAGTYHGYLDYHLNRDALEIHTMSALPHGSRLGSLLLFEAALQAVWHHRERIEALNVAAISRGFYLAAAMHPSRTSHDAVEKMELNTKEEFYMKFHLSRSAGTWDGETHHVKGAAFRAIENRWT